MAGDLAWILISAMLVNNSLAAMSLLGGKNSNEKVVRCLLMWSEMCMM